jgi:3-oxoacyl-[acyl-carrier protein] reductase
MTSAADSLDGRVCILAGGTGGIGAALARTLAAEGARLVLGYRGDRARAEALAAELSTRTLVRVVGGDIVAPDVRDELLARAHELGAPYALVVLAGDPARPAAGAASQGEIEASLRTNFVGPVMLARAFAEARKESGGAAIVLLATMQALDAFAGSLAYAAPKAALVHAARLLAKEYGGPGDVRVNVVAPGVTQAGMAEASIRAGKYDRFIAGGAITRFARADDVVRAIRFFLSPDGYVTGQTLLVDGGLTLRRDVLAR